ncbi:translation elongation factor Ts [Thermoproteota archaeon]
MTISAKLVKELRDKTGVGMMACKKALIESNGDMEEAVKYLREKGLATAAKKSTREANEGRMVTAVSDDRTRAVVLELNCETDFVANNDAFIAFGNLLAGEILRGKHIASLDDVQEMKIGTLPLKETLAELVLKVGENCTVNQLNVINTTGQLYNYTHMNGKIGVLVEFSSEVDSMLGKDIAMQIAAANPRYILPQDVPAQELKNESEIIKTQALNEGKPEAIIDKLVQGKLNKYYKDVCLMEQAYIKDPKTSVKQLLPQNVSVKQFFRYTFA